MFLERSCYTLSHDFSRPKFPSGVKRFSNIYIHRLAEDELVRFFEADFGKKPVLLAHYQKRLEYLSNHLGSEFTHHEWFEPVKKNAPYRAIRFCKVKLLGNLRILYCIADDCAWLLAAFQEKRTGTDYQRPLENAKQRAVGLLK